jgi:excisionase family DNA binding protein
MSWRYRALHMNTPTDNRAARRELPRLALSIKETAAALGISTISVRRLINRGLLRPNRALRHLRIPAGEIERFLSR